MNNLELFEKFGDVPEKATKTINAGRLKGMTDIKPIWRFEKLTEQFGPIGVGWYYNITNKELVTCGSEVVAFVDIELFFKHEGEWSKPIHGNGGSMLIAQERNGLHVSDEAYKMATTDALSVACRTLGIGAQVYYGNNDGSKYSKKSHTPIDCNDLIMLANKKGASAKNLEKAIIKQYGHGMEFITKQEYDTIYKAYEGLPDRIKD